MLACTRPALGAVEIQARRDAQVGLARICTPSGAAHPGDASGGVFPA